MRPVMSSSLLIVLVAQGVFVLLLGTVGVRLVLLARRTRRAPELALGIGLCAVIVGIPLLGIAGLRAEPVTEVRFPLLATALFLLWLGMSSMMTFTWRAFRPEALWAAGLTAVMSGGLALVLAGIWQGIASAAPSTLALAASKPWLYWVRVPFSAGLLWTGAEALRQHRMAQRRLALDLGDPVVANRFLLWSLVSFVTLMNNGVGTALQLQGRGPNNDPLAAAMLALGGVVGGSLVLLAFMPPPGWLRFVRRRAKAS